METQLFKYKVWVLVLIIPLLIQCRKHEPPEEKVPLGEILVDLNANESVVRKKEALIGNFICDAVSEYIENKGIEFDFVIYNSGAIRYDGETRPDGIYPAGTFYTSDLNEMLPFGNVLTIISLSGNQIYEIFERSVAQYPLEKGPFLQVSQGLKVEIDTLGSPQLINLEENQIVSAGNRILNIQLNGVDIDPGTIYKVIMSDFLANGNDGYVTMRNLNSSLKVFLEDHETNAITDYVIINSPVNVELSQRLVFN